MFAGPAPFTYTGLYSPTERVSSSAVRSTGILPSVIRSPRKHLRRQESRILDFSWESVSPAALSRPTRGKNPPHGRTVTEVGRADDRKDLAASQLILFSVHGAARNATLMFPDRMMVIDQVPIMLPAAECAAHRHLASSEHDEIARLSAELGFQVAASRRAGELYAGLYAHRDTPLLAGRIVSCLAVGEARFGSEVSKDHHPNDDT
jgi:hypothetical protein